MVLHGKIELIYLKIFFQFLKLGCTSFGGPIAHLSFFQKEFVDKENLLSHSQYSSLVALCQFLPGPASSQVGMAIGLMKGSILGSIMAWLGFTFPSASIMILLGWGIASFNISNSIWFHGFKLAAVSIVFQAVISMAKSLSPDRIRMGITFLTTAIVLLFPTTYSQIFAMLLSGILGFILLPKFLSQNLLTNPELEKFPIKITSTFSLYSLVFFFLFLFLLPFFRYTIQDSYLILMDSFFRVGALVFGGGHVVLPLLEKEVVTPGWISKENFLIGYGFANALPGPLFSFSAYLGFVQNSSPNGIIGALISLVFVFLPSFFLVWGIFPFWNTIQKIPQIRWIIMGFNAGVVGILLAAFYNPVFLNSVLNSKDFVIVVLGFILLEYWNAPSYFVVFLSAFFAFILNIYF